MADKDNDPQAEDFETVVQLGAIQHKLNEAERDFETPEVISLDLEYPDEVAVVKLALQQTSILSNVVLGKDAARILARIDNELAG